MSMVQHIDRGNPELATFTSAAAGLARLVHKIHQAHAGLAFAVRSRNSALRRVPRTELADRLTRLEQMISDWMYVTGRWDAGGMISERALLDTAANILKINLEKLREEVKR